MFLSVIHKLDDKQFFEIKCILEHLIIVVGKLGNGVSDSDIKELAVNLKQTTDALGTVVSQNLQNR